jgi:hypothetical protein
MQYEPENKRYVSFFNYALLLLHSLLSLQHVFFLRYTLLNLLCTVQLIYLSEKNTRELLLNILSNNHERMVVLVYAITYYLTTTSHRTN